MARLLDEHAGPGWCRTRRSATMSPPRAARSRRGGPGPARVFVPQEHLAGREAEVDFGDVGIRLGGVLVTCALFTFRLSYSGKAVHRVVRHAGQEAFLEGHVHAFTELGGVPAGQIRYDNLKAAVARVSVRPQPDRVRHGGSRSGRTTGSTRSTASPASTARTRRAASRARAAGSAATTWSRARGRLARRAQRALGRRRRRPTTPGGSATARQHRRARLRRRGAAAAPAADRAVRDRADARPRGSTGTPGSRCGMYHYSVPARLIGRQVRVLLRASSWSCSTAASRSPATRGSTARGGQTPGPGPLPGGPAPQTRRAARRDRAGPGPRGRDVHRGARGVLGRGPQAHGDAAGTRR